jgi:hypothetical protein
MPMSPRLLRPISSTLDADAAAYLNAVAQADGQQLEPAVRKAINDFVIGCKSDGIWDAIKASCILAGARTLDGALVPLKGSAPTNNNFVSGDYNRKTGLKGDGSTKYLDSNRANDADPQNSNHNAVYVTALDTITERGSVLMGGGANETGSNNLGYSYIDPNSFFRNRSASNIGVSGGQDETGLFATNRSNSSAVQYRFGGVTGTITQTSETPDSSDVLVFSRSDGFATDARLAFYSIGESLDLTLLDNRVSALITAIGGVLATVPGAPTITSSEQDHTLGQGNEIYLAWTKPSDGGLPILGYYVYVDDNRLPDQEFATSPYVLGPGILNASVYHYAGADLLEGTEVSVSAYNAIGEGPKSEAIVPQLQ